MPKEQEDQKSLPPILEKDVHSYSEPEKVRVTKLHLDLHPSFETKQLTAVAELNIEWLAENAHDLVLDSKGLDIKKIEVENPDGTWKETSFEWGKSDSILGTALHVNATSDNKKVKISYQTSKDAEGLQWLDPKQTANKQHPFLYSQSEPIGARTWMPIQDTPGVRFTYSATIHTPPKLRAVMSANNDADRPVDDQMGKFEFDMPQAIPSYLVAFAIGDISAKKISERSAVYTESTVLDAAWNEFNDTEEMIQAASDLYGPYQWGTYDILVLPPSFPMGGMENPRLTFATPTVITGDKSLISLVAHELAHSWSGNLVTNATWAHIWLNEGFTNYVENRIIEAKFGKKRADDEFLNDLGILDTEMKSQAPENQRLVPDLENRDPDEGFNFVAYIKGAWFLKTLEHTFGREAFDDFLRLYFKKHAFQSNTTDNFKAFLQANLFDLYPEVKYSMAQVNAWLDQPGIPEDAVKIVSPNLSTNDTLREEWLAGKIKASELNPEGKWTSTEWQYFLKRLPKQLSVAQLKELDDAYSLTGMNNHVVGAEWYKITLANEYSAANNAIREHLVNIGRRYLVAPLYEEMLKTESGCKLAQSIYAEARDSYHSLTRDFIDKKFKEHNVSITPETAEVKDGAIMQAQALNLMHFKTATPSVAHNEVELVQGVQLK